jgi:intracellular septation protein
VSKRFIVLSLVEFGPLTLFFFVSAIWGFYPGATALVASTVAALVYSILVFKRFAAFSFAVSLLTLVFGTATVYLHKPIWIVLEYTITNLIFGIILFMANHRGHPILKDFFGHMFSITDKGWVILSERWAWAFIIIGVTNQAFWHLYPYENLWTLFRFIATLLTFIFGMYQLTVSKRERLPDSTAWGLRR